MAILSEHGNQYEVRIKRIPQNTYFKEHVKVGDRQKPDDFECDRYIVGEPGQKYAVEISIKEGFRWDDYDRVSMSLYLPGDRDPIACDFVTYSEGKKLGIGKVDVNIDLDCVNHESRREFHGAPFSFRNLAIDDTLVNEANVLGVNPLSLGSFCVDITKQWKTNELRRPDSSEVTQNIFSAQKIDQESSKKHGIAFAIGLAGCRKDTEVIYASKHFWEYTKPLKFNFHFHTPEFLEQLSIVPYPPPLHYYAWEELQGPERKIALTKLQSISKTEWLERTGQSEENGWVRKEWRDWYCMSRTERKYTFEKLQKEHKAYERGEVRKEIAQLPRHKIINLEGEGVLAIRRVKRTSSQTPTLRQGTFRSSVLKQESFDLDSSPNIKSSLKRPRALLEQGIKQEPIYRDNFESKTDMPHATIKYDLTRDDEPSAKRVKFEDDRKSEIVIKMEDDEDGDSVERQEVIEHEDCGSREENIGEEM